MKRGKLLKLSMAAALIFTIISEKPLHAEYVFKNDGSIIQGTIVNDFPTSISVKKMDDAVEQVNRKDIIRIIYTELYLGKVYARLTTGEIVEGFMVYEDRDNYFFRKDLAKPEEFTIPRIKVMFISHTNPTDVRGKPSTDFITVTWSPPFKPAKFFRLYIRDVLNKEENFRVAGETNETAFIVKNLRKSWTYEFYATAISDYSRQFSSSIAWPQQLHNTADQQIYDRAVLQAVTRRCINIRIKRLSIAD